MNELIQTYEFHGDIQERLDKFLVKCLPEYSRSRIQALIKEGQVQVDGLAVHKAGTILDKCARITVQIPPEQPTTLIPESIALNTIFENRDILIINKPAGMVVHPATGHHTGTLVHAALAHDPAIGGIGGQGRPGIVHRLDKDTSGLIILAKNDAAHHWLTSQFHDRKVVKIYLALVDGHPPTPAGRVEAPIGRSPTDRKKMSITTPGKGRQAVTEYKTLENFPQHTLLQVRPITGRTHQIRLHAAFLGCPVAGDTVYGRKHPSLPIKRHFLHAAQLTFCLPGGRTAQHFEAPLPEELQTLLVELRRTG